MLYLTLRIELSKRHGCCQKTGISFVHRKGVNCDNHHICNRKHMQESSPSRRNVRHMHRNVLAFDYTKIFQEYVPLDFTMSTVISVCGSFVGEDVPIFECSGDCGGGKISDVHKNSPTLFSWYPP